MISHRYWQRAFGGSPSAVGQSLMVNGTPREVIGVLPEDFQFLRANPLVILPMKIDRATIHAAGFNYQGLARLKPGVTIEQANADVERLLPSLTQRFKLPPGFTQKMFDDARFGSLVRPLDVDVVGDIGSMLWILLGTVGLVLLVACANVANLFLVRAEARQQELAIRLALGAEARRVAWQLMSESLLVAHDRRRRSASRWPTAASSCSSTCSPRSCRGSTRSRSIRSCWPSRSASRSSPDCCSAPSRSRSTRGRTWPRR